MDTCEPGRGCVHEERPATELDGVLCSAGNVRDLLRFGPGGTGSELTRIERQLTRGAQAVRRGACLRRLKAAVQDARHLERTLTRYANGSIISPEPTRRLAQEATRLRERAKTLATTRCAALGTP